jgi:hypothetical protein
MEFNDLPVELKVQIFGWLDSFELSKVALVCEHWRELSEQNVLWRGFTNGCDETLQNVKLKEVVIGRKLQFERSKKSGFYRTLFPWIFLVLMITTSIGCWMAQSQEYKTNNYIPVKAKVKEAYMHAEAVHDDDDGDVSFYVYSPRIHYEYECAGEVVHSTKIYPMYLSEVSGLDCTRGILSKYTNGSECIAYVDPTSCSNDQFLIKYTDFMIFLVILIPFIVMVAVSSIWVVRVSRDVSVENPFPFKVYQPDFNKWLCEYLPTENERLSTNFLFKMNAILGVLYHTIGTASFLLLSVWANFERV